MKNKKYLSAILGIVMVLFIAYLIPDMISILEDRGLQSEIKKYEIDEIELNSGKVDLTDKLLSIQAVLQDYVVVQKEQLQEEQKENEIAKNAKEFLSVLYDNSEKQVIKFSAMQLVMTNSNQVYSLWNCYVVDADGCESILWLDEDTRKVLAFEIPFVMSENNTEEFFGIVERLKEYYGFSGYKVMNEVPIFLKREYTENTLKFYDEVKGTEVPIMFYKNGNKLNFNMYPGQISVSNTTIYR